MTLLDLIKLANITKRALDEAHANMIAALWQDVYFSCPATEAAYDEATITYVICKAADQLAQQNLIYGFYLALAQPVLGSYRSQY
jgi:hypothetical protein